MRYGLAVPVVFFVLLFSIHGPSQAQTSDTCPASVMDAIRAIGTVCDNLDRNNACYGSDHIEASFSQAVDTAIFDQPSDRAALDLFQTLRTAPFNTATGQWGAAVLKLQADIPNTLPGQTVTLLLIGDTEVQNLAGSAQTPMEAFTFTTGIAPNCAEVPPSSLILQGPRGMVVDLTVNGAQVRLGSTAVLRTEDNRLEVATLDGRVVLDNDIILSRGTMSSAALDEDGMVIEDSWAEAEYLDETYLEYYETLEFLPDEWFEYEVELPEEEEIELMEMLDSELVNSLDPYSLDEMIDMLLADGLDAEALESLSDDEYYQALYDSLAADDPELGDAFYEALTGEDVDGDGLIAGFDADAYYYGDDFYSYDESLAGEDDEDVFDDEADDDSSDDFTDEDDSSFSDEDEDDSAIEEENVDDTGEDFSEAEGDE